MRCLVAVVLLFVVSSARADWQANAITAGIIGTGLADYTTTKIALSRGGVEANPVMRIPEPWLGVVKIGVTGLVAVTMHQAMTKEPHPTMRRGAKWIGLGICVFQGWVVNHNVGVIVRLRK